MNDTKWTAATVVYMCAFAYVISMIVYQLVGLITGEAAFGVFTIVALAALAGLVYLVARKNKYADVQVKVGV